MINCSSFQTENLKVMAHVKAVPRNAKTTGETAIALVSILLYSST